MSIEHEERHVKARDPKAGIMRALGLDAFRPEDADFRVVTDPAASTLHLTARLTPDQAWKVFEAYAGSQGLELIPRPEAPPTYSEALGSLVGARVVPPDLRLDGTIAGRASTKSAPWPLDADDDGKRYRIEMRSTYHGFLPMHDARNLTREAARRELDRLRAGEDLTRYPSAYRIEEEAAPESGTAVPDSPPEPPAVAPAPKFPPGTFARAKDIGRPYRHDCHGLKPGDRVKVLANGSVSTATGWATYNRVQATDHAGEHYELLDCELEPDAPEPSAAAPAGRAKEVYLDVSRGPGGDLVVRWEPADPVPGATYSVRAVVGDASGRMVCRRTVEVAEAGVARIPGLVPTERLRVTLWFSLPGAEQSTLISSWVGPFPAAPEPPFAPGDWLVDRFGGRWLVTGAWPAEGIDTAGWSLRRIGARERVALPDFDQLRQDTLDIYEGDVEHFGFRRDPLQDPPLPEKVAAPQAEPEPDEAARAAMTRDRDHWFEVQAHVDGRWSYLDAWEITVPEAYVRNGSTAARKGAKRARLRVVNRHTGRVIAEYPAIEPEPKHPDFKLGDVVLTSDGRRGMVYDMSLKCEAGPRADICVAYFGAGSRAVLRLRDHAPGSIVVLGNINDFEA